MKITILGGSGLVGSGIKRVLKKNHNVFSFDSSVYNKKKNSFHFQKFSSSDLLIFAASVTDEEITKKNVKFIINKYKLMLKNLIYFFKKKNLKYFAYISSIHVSNYLQSNFLKKEIEKKTVKYAYCHLEIEKLIKKMLIKTGIKCLILRPSNVYGFTEKKNFNRKNLITYSFPMSLIKTNKITIKSSGYQKRNFCSNFEVGRYIDLWLKKNNKLKISTKDVLGKETLSIVQFAKKCISAYNKSFKNSSKLIIKKIIKQDNKSFNDKKNLYRYSINNYLKDFFKYY